MNSPKKAHSAEDRRFMRSALFLARRGLGSVAPNPSVGCVIVAPGGMVVGRGWTQPGGRPHAEAEALGRAGERSRGATAFVTLEPCSHYGKTPPCAETLIDAGVKRAVVAIEDPDERVSGRGLKSLREAGVDVTLGVMAAEAEELNMGFIMHRRTGRPLVTLKSATTLDGRIATHTGASHWITGALARRRAHLMRMSHDAIVVGIGTALADDPELTCRLPGLEVHDPVRVVIDSRLQLPLTSKLVQTARKTPTWVVISAETDPERCKAYKDLGVLVIPVSVGPDRYPDPLVVLRELGDRGLTRVLVEGGSSVDRLAWFRAAAVIGGDGVPAIAAFGVDELSQMRRFELLSFESLGDDRLETYSVVN